MPRRTAAPPAYLPTGGSSGLRARAQGVARAQGGVERSLVVPPFPRLRAPACARAAAAAAASSPPPLRLLSAAPPPLRCFAQCLLRGGASTPCARLCVRVWVGRGRRAAAALRRRRRRRAAPRRRRTMRLCACASAPVRLCLCAAAAALHVALGLCARVRYPLHKKPCARACVCVSQSLSMTDSL